MSKARHHPTGRIAFEQVLLQLLSEFEIVLRVYAHVMPASEDRARDAVERALNGHGSSWDGRQRDTAPAREA